MNRLNRKRGFTLIEILVSIALFVMLVVVGSMAIMKGVQAQRFDHNVREGKAAVRNALDRLTDEMRSACPLPYQSGSSYDKTAVVAISGVLYPDPYKSNKGGYNTLPVRTDATGEEYIYSTDRTIFTRLTDKSDSGNINKFVFVDWLVSGNKINRRVYAMKNTLYSFVLNTSKGYSIAQCWAKLGNFTNSGYKTDSNSVVAQLPGDFDTFKLEVRRTANKDTLNRAGTAFDLNSFNIVLKATVYHPAHGDNSGKYKNKKVDIELSTRVALEISDSYY